MSTDEVDASRPMTVGALKRFLLEFLPQEGLRDDALVGFSARHGVELAVAAAIDSVVAPDGTRRQVFRLVSQGETESIVEGEDWHPVGVVKRPTQN